MGVLQPCNQHRLGAICRRTKFGPSPRLETPSGDELGPKVCARRCSKIHAAMRASCRADLAETLMALPGSLIKPDCADICASARSDGSLTHSSLLVALLPRGCDHNDSLPRMPMYKTRRQPTRARASPVHHDLLALAMLTPSAKLCLTAKRCCSLRLPRQHRSLIQI